MTKPSELDTSDIDRSALYYWNKTKAGARAFSHWFDEEIFNRDLVASLLSETGYPQDRLHFVEGPVEETIPEHVAEQLSLLRLDTDWYESTRHEMLHLYPRLTAGGVLIIDDYGHWNGSRLAIDEYFASGAAPPLMLARVDYSCRVAVKI
jgi:hypothetical protein